MSSPNPISTSISASGSSPTKTVLGRNSWLEIQSLPDDLAQYARTNFEKLFNARPEQKAQVLVHTRQDEPAWRIENCQRWMKSYLQTPAMAPENPEQKSYMFSGKPDDVDSNGPLPDEFQPFYDFMREIDPQFNQVVINWYDPADLIPPHHDCELGMVDNHKIAVLSLNPNDSPARDLLIESRDGSQPHRTFVPLVHGSIINMCGDIQKHFRHSIGQGNTKRISVSFRQFQN